MNKSSLSSIINFIFAMAAGFLILTFLLFIIYEKDQFANKFASKYSVITSIIEDEKSYSLSGLSQKIEKLNLKLLFDKDVLDHAKNNFDDRIEVFEYKEKLYLTFLYNNLRLLFLDKDYEPYEYYKMLILFLISLIILLFSYYLIHISLKPLQTLTSKVEEFSKGNLDVQVKIKGTTEISNLALAFNSAITHTKKINESRRLFMRNIMHEIKTPITKGKLLLSLPQNDTNSKRMQNVFNRLEELIKEFTIIEEYSAGLLNPKLQIHTFSDIYKDAVNLAMVGSRHIKTRGNLNNTYLVDKDLLIIAVKNMIDNAIKYSPDKEVLISVQKDKIEFINKGQRLDKELKYYIQPFAKKSSSKDSLGLGLYIVSNILKSNEIKLKYRYSKNKNIFIFEF
ncbi:MAG: Histidine kinase [uncultured Campylobacterales bacterium]|uniref:histidine kinase n=1 Tax=uncultured Campylobacterales bacterium TaxID=352960 RepID=A0A6S6T578_9BACT|nr:MAG: Histidine kinase [uncultured Campylobacterales bacterium]